jgi:hypothetical protein
VGSKIYILGNSFSILCAIVGLHRGYRYATYQGPSMNAHYVLLNVIGDGVNIKKSFYFSKLHRMLFIAGVHVDDVKMATRNVLTETI